MQLLSLTYAAIWVDFAVMVLTKLVPGQHIPFLPPTHALQVWYDTFGVAAVAADVLSLMLGVIVVLLLFPRISFMSLLIGAIVVQLLHDIFFYMFVIRGLPSGHNQMIDVFKTYADEGGATILLADSLMMAAVVTMATFIEKYYSQQFIAFKSLLGAYALIYITYTK